MSHHQSLRSLRLEKGWSQEQLALISGLSERTVQRAERGDTPSLETLGALAASFDLSSAQMRDILTPPERAHQREPAHDKDTEDMAKTHDTTPAAVSTSEDTPSPRGPQPLLTPVTKRLLLAGAIYVLVLSWLVGMQSVADWDSELVGYVALVGGGLLASFAYFQLSGREK